MARCARGSLAFACALACGPDAASPAALADVCGGKGPFRILALADDERLLGVRRIADRYHFTVGTAVDSTGEPESTTRVVATGSCGEAPIEIARDVFLVFEHERWPGRVLGCSGSDGGAFVVLDPAGVERPRVVMPAPACRGTPTDHGIVAVLELAGSDSALVQVPWPEAADGPATAAVVLAEATRGEPYPPAYAVRGDDVFTVLANHDLVRIALPSGATSIEQSSVGEWGVSTDARVLAWRDFDPLVDPATFPAGTLHLRDRSDGRTVQLGDVSLHALPPIASADWLATTAGPQLTRFVELPSFATLDVPGEHRVRNQILDGRLLVSRDARGPLAILDPNSGELTTLAEVGGELRGGTFDHVDVFAAPDGGVDEAGLWRVPFDAGPAVELAERASRGWFELGGRIVTPLDVDDGGLGDLVLVDPQTLAERVVDQRVVASVQGRGEHATFHELDIVYSVVDGERTGIWVARLLPP